jgi:CBS domain-containing protein
VNFDVPDALPFYIVLGVICGLAAVAFSNSLYFFEDMFEKLPVDEMWWPAIGAIGLGIIGYFIPRVLGVGYDTIGDILNGNLPIKLLLLVMIFKSLALVISLGAGTSGGLLAPMFMSSAAMGGVFAVAMNHIFPNAHLTPNGFALVAMGAVFGAAARAPFTFIIFAFEITRNYDSVLPLMLVTVIADAIAMALARSSIMTEKLVRRGLHIHQDYEADVLQEVTVHETMDTNAVTLPPDMKVSELANRIARRDPVVLAHQGYPIVDVEGHLVGVITRHDLLHALDKDPQGRMTVLEAGTKDPIVTYPDELLYDAVAKMLRHNVGRLPVVDPDTPSRVVGYLGRSNVMAARARRMEEEYVREPGWLKRFLP